MHHRSFAWQLAHHFQLQKGCIWANLDGTVVKERLCRVLIGSCCLPALPWQETNPCHFDTGCALQRTIAAMFGDPGSLFLQPREEPAMFLFKNDSRTPESPCQANLGMCHKAKWLPWLERERMRGEVHTWNSDAGWIGQRPGSLVVLAQTRI